MGLRFLFSGFSLISSPIHVQSSPYFHIIYSSVTASGKISRPKFIASGSGDMDCRIIFEKFKFCLNRTRVNWTIWTVACAPPGPTILDNRTRDRGSNLGARPPRVKFFCAEFFSKWPAGGCDFSSPSASSGRVQQTYKFLLKSDEQFLRKWGSKIFGGVALF